MEKIKTGLAAFGMSGQIFHAPFISTNPAFCLTAITERNKNLSKERYPSARIVRSFEELVAWMSWNWSLSIRQTVRITSIHGKHWRQEKM